LWSGDGSTLLATTTVLSSDPLTGGYRYHALASPVALSPGGTYLIGAEVGSSIAFFYDAGNNAFVSANPTIIITDCRYHSGTSLAAPTSSGGGAIARWATANVSFIGGYSTTVTPATNWGAWDGWGVSLGWWANVFGNRDDLADIVFTTNYTTLNGYLLPGLGLNIARFNAGGCGTNTIGSGTNAFSMQLSPNMPLYAQMQGYWLNWDSIDPSSASWNWGTDANQRAMLVKAKSRGANLLELFSNSPMWWMCYNHNPCGANSGANDNLQSWDYDTHAMYLATIAKYAQTNWGVTFDSVEPFNEPDGTWGTTNGPSEACHYENSTQASVIGYLRSELNSRGLTSMKIAASDASSCDPATTIWNSFSSTVQGQVAQVNTHGYGYTTARRDLLYSATAGKKLWQSETGDNDTSGMFMITNLCLDFAQLHPSGWCYWQPFDDANWGLIQSTDATGWIGSPNRKYFVLAQFSRHIRQGMTIMGSGDANTVAAYDATNHTLVLVTANDGTAQWITYSLTNFSTASGPVQQWVTITGYGPSYQPGTNITVNQRVFSAYFPANTIKTFQVQNVNYP
jgi:galactan endo-1,6-beta-galactosidase